MLYHASGEIVEFPEIRKSRYPTHQISFHTLKALDCLAFERSENVNEWNSKKWFILRLFTYRVFRKKI